jgi:hypothetical protein
MQKQDYQIIENNNKKIFLNKALPKIDFQILNTLNFIVSFVSCSIGIPLNALSYSGLL